MPEYLALYNISETGVNGWGNRSSALWTRKYFFNADNFDKAREVARQYRHFIEHPAGYTSPATILEKLKEEEGKLVYKLVQTGQSCNPDLNFPNLHGLQISQ